MKRCRKCNFEKTLDEFGIDKQKSDGLCSYCKECIKKRSKKQRENDPIYYEEYEKNYRVKNRIVLREKAKEIFWRDREKRLQQSKKSYLLNRDKIAKKRAIKRRTEQEKEKIRSRMFQWRKNNKKKVYESVCKWKENNEKKKNAHSLVLYAIKTEILQRRENCEECNKKCKTEGHHEDYKKTLDVIWLCKLCHSKKHRIYR